MSGREHPAAGTDEPPAEPQPPLLIAGASVPSGSRAEVSMPIGRLVTGERMALPVMVVHGATAGPSVWMNAAIHGDEIGGVEIISRVLRWLDPTRTRGTVLAVPVVNVHGFVTGDRYLPDRRDLNRSFPGAPGGSLAAQVAHLFMSEIVARAEIGIDLHTGSDHRTNLPQVRADLADPRARALAEVFGAPLMIHSKPRAGTLRHAAGRAGATVLLYEAGEAWRFDEAAITAGVMGVLRVLAAVGVVDPIMGDPQPSLVADRSSWVRAPRSGILHLDVAPGERVRRRQVLGSIDDTFGNRLAAVRAGAEGLVIGITRYPLVNRGDAVVHVAAVQEPSSG